MERAALHSQAGCIFPGSFTASLLTILGMRSECKAESLSLSSVCCLCQALVTSGASLLFQFFLHLGLFGCFFPHEQRVYRRKKKKKKQSQNLIPAEKHGKSNHSSSTKPLVKCQQETVQKCSSLCLQRPTQAQVLQGVHLYTEKGPGLQPSLQALSILKDSAAPFTTILVQGTSLS